MTTRTRASTLALLVVMILLGVGLRLFQLYDAPIRGDEVFTIRYWMRQPIAVTLANNVVEDPHPPLIIGLYRSWSLLLGGDERVARFLPALVNVIGIAGIYALGKRLAGRTVGLLVALLWVLHPFEVWHAQDARSYGVWAAANVVTAWLGVRALGTMRRRDVVLYVLAATAGAYLYYLELFTIAALTLWAFLVYRRDGRRLRGWTVANAAVGLLLAPWFLQPRLFAGGGYGGTTGGFDPGLLLTWFLPTLTFGETLSADAVAALWPVLLVPLVAGAFVWQRRSPRRALLPVLLVVVPAALLALVSLRLYVFTPRYIMSVIPGLLLLVAYLAVLLWRRGAVLRVVGLAVSFGWVALSLISLSNYYFEYTKVPPWPALVAYLEANARPDDMIVQAAADEAFNYYLDELDEPFDRKQLPANPGQDAAEITALLDADLQRHERMWRVAQTFTDWPSYGVAEAWFEANMQRVVDTTVAGLRTQEWRRWDVDTTTLPPEPLTQFGDVAVLRDVEIIQDGGDQPEIVVLLYWEPLRQTDAPLTGSVQLIGPTNPATGTPLWSQDDHAPQMGRVETTDWQPDTIYRDVYTLDLTAVTAGDYTLVARLYDPATGARVPVGAEDGATVGSVTLP